MRLLAQEAERRLCVAQDLGSLLFPHSWRHLQTEPVRDDEFDRLRDRDVLRMTLNQHPRRAIDNDVGFTKGIDGQPRRLSRENCVRLYDLEVCLFELLKPTVVHDADRECLFCVLQLFERSDGAFMPFPQQLQVEKVAVIGNVLRRDTRDFASVLRGSLREVVCHSRVCCPFLRCGDGWRELLAFGHAGIEIVLAGCMVLAKLIRASSCRLARSSWSCARSNNVASSVNCR